MWSAVTTANNSSPISVVPSLRSPTCHVTRLPPDLGAVSTSTSLAKAAELTTHFHGGTLELSDDTIAPLPHDAAHAPPYYAGPARLARIPVGFAAGVSGHRY